MSFKDKYMVIDQAEMDGIRVEILEMSNLEGASSPYMAANLFFAKQAGLKARMVKISLNQSAIKTIYFSLNKLD